MKDCADNKKSAVLKQRIAILAIQLHIQKILVYSCIAVKLRVESGDKLFSLSCGNYLSADLGENFRIIEHLIDIRCADKCHPVELRDKIKVFVPKDCVVGRLLHNFADYTIIESKSFSIEQHNMFNWETDGRELKQANEFSVFSDTIAQTLKGGMLCLNSKELNRIYHIICTIIERCGIDSKNDINMAFIQKLIALLIEDDKLFSPDLIENIIKSLGKGFLLYLKQ